MELDITLTKNRFLVAIASVCLGICPGHSRTSKEWQQADAATRRAFPAATQVTNLALPLSRTEKDSLRSLAKQELGADTLQLLVVYEANRLLGYAIIDDVKGKDQPITYCLVVNTNLEVKEMEILRYREPYGGEVQNKSWLKQFFGKQPTDELRPGKEIKNITGATISSRAITLGVKKLLALLRIVSARLPHTTLLAK